VTEASSLGAVHVQTATTRVRDLRIAAGATLGAAAVWPLLPVHPPLACPLRATTGIPCPFCGLTRAVVAAVQGDLAASVRYNPLGILVVLLAVIVVARPQVLRPRLPARAAPFLLGGGAALLWAYNVTLNPTF
jgi:hypothetical protein